MVGMSDSTSCANAASSTSLSINAPGPARKIPSIEAVLTCFSNQHSEWLQRVDSRDQIAVSGKSANGATSTSLRCRANVRKREGFRMPARGDLCTRGEGRRPKASEEGTRGPLAGGLPSMGI